MQVRYQAAPRPDRDANAKQPQPELQSRSPTIRECYQLLSLEALHACGSDWNCDALGECSLSQK
jgi:hypothetical protein